MPHVVFERNNLLDTPLKKGDIEFLFTAQSYHPKDSNRKIEYKIATKNKDLEFLLAIKEKDENYLINGAPSSSFFFSSIGVCLAYR